MIDKPSHIAAVQWETTGKVTLPANTRGVQLVFVPTQEGPTFGPLKLFFESAQVRKVDIKMCCDGTYGT